MPHKQKFILAPLLCTLLLACAPLVQAFSDITDSFRYATAIEYLFNHGVINGYPDDTYRPENSVTRVEFLKLVMESSNTELNSFGSSGFSDIDETAWYAPYVRKAKTEGWIEGYEGNVFKPEQKINKVEGLKIIAEIQNWPKETPDELPYKDLRTTDWYASFVTYANSKNFLEERTYFIPDEILSRGRIADILYRIHITNANNATVYSTQLKDVGETTPTTSSVIPLPTLATPPELDFTPESFNSTAKNFFTDVTLNEELPNIFYLNEIYTLEGTINERTYSKAFVFLAEEGNTNSNDFIDYVGAVENSKFKIPIIFRKPGNYQLGLILGNEGESKIIKISVLPSLPINPATSNKQKPLKTKIAYTNGKTSVTWDNNNNDLIRVNIYQGKKTQSYVLRQKKESLDIAYQDFGILAQGVTYLEIDGATTSKDAPLSISSQWAHSDPIQFSATEHQFSTVEKNDITISGGLKDFMTTLSPIDISGTTQKDIYQEAIITKPDGTVTSNNLTSTKPVETYFGSQIIKQGNDFTFHYTPTTPGTYIVEINGKDGSAVINAPIYIKTGIPLTPDYFDLHNSNEQEKDFDLAEDRKDLLELINRERIKYDLVQVEIDASLNNLAQLHSEDMAKRDYFSHIDPDGKTPNDRRIALNIPTAVGENLAQAPNIFYSHFGLMRSGIHRRNILDPKWTRVGLGIAKDEQGQLLVTQEFSTYPLSSIDLAKIKVDYLNQINNYRSDKKIVEFSIDQVLADVAQSWSDKMADQGFFAFTSPNGESLTSMVQKAVSGKAVQALILESSDQKNLIDEILKTEEIGQSQWTKIGIGLKADNIGDLKATLLFTTH